MKILIARITNMMNKLDILKNISEGTFNYKKYKDNYCDPKFNSPTDIKLSYMSQLPYFKVVTYPIVTAIIITEWLPIIILVLIENLKDKMRVKLNEK